MNLTGGGIRRARKIGAHMTVSTTGFDCDVVLKDGSTLTVRIASVASAPSVLSFLNGLSTQSLYQRFLGSRKMDLASARRLTVDDPAMGVALVGEIAGRIVAMAGYCRSPQVDRAEVAFATADDLQGKGIATRLLDG